MLVVQSQDRLGWRILSITFFQFVSIYLSTYLSIYLSIATLVSIDRWSA